MNRPYHEIYSAVSKCLPSGVILYMSLKSPDKYRVVYTDLDHQHNYFEKEYFIYSEDRDSGREMIADAKAFTEKWNSPLMKALR